MQMKVSPFSTESSVAANDRKILTEFDACKLVVLNVETVSKTENFSMNHSFIIYRKTIR